MNKISDLFPSSESVVIFFGYMILCTGQGIFVTASHTKEGYRYNIVTVVFLTEAVKLVLAFLCYIKSNSVSSLWSEIENNLKILHLYLVPSFLYCIYNNLAFVNLSHFDPTTYFILLQLRVVVTGIIFQVVFNKKLTKIQWISLVLLTFGCMLQQVDWNYVKGILKNENQNAESFFSIYPLFIIIQTLCSCSAGVYNEHLLKHAGTKVNIFIQNMFMYIDSILWNFAVILLEGNVLSTLSWESIQHISQPLVLTIIMNNALTGIAASLFLKNLNSILKTFASAIEILLTAVLSWLFFGIEIKPNTIFAIFIVLYSLYVYSKNPVVSKEKIVSDNAKEEASSLIKLQEV